MVDKVYTLQKQVAASTDELLEISNSISEIIPQYGTIDNATYNLQLNFLKNRCNKLKSKLLDCQEKLEGVSTKESVAVTNQLITQNIIILSQKIELIDECLSHSKSIKSQLSVAKQINNLSDIERLRTLLRKELK